jgi:AmmeMemoRadiSam system protein A
LLYAQKKGPVEVDVLRYADSSGAGGPDTGVVGYFAAALYLRSGSEPSFSLAPDEKRELLRIARLAVEQAVETNALLEYKTDNENLLVPKGAFVTLTKNGTLRGCIGFIDPVYPLGQTIIHASYFAALEDRRFNPVSKAELKDLEVEISVLSPLTRIIDYRLVQVGKHGLVIAQGERKGLLLPQVAVDNGWTRDEFLEEACLKAGLGPDAWKKGAEIYTFEAIVFR